MGMTAFLRWLFLVAGLMLMALQADAAEPWQALPPQPSLPQARHAGQVPINDIQLWYAEFGTGKPVILVHGGLSNANYWGHLVPFLVQHHYRVIVLDSRGHGRSTRSSQDYSYDLMASDVLALMDRLKIGKADLVGWSDGGIIGLDIAMHHPERLDHLFAFGANTNPAGLREDFDKSPVFSAFMKRSGEEYRQLSSTPDQYESFMQQIGHMWETQPNWTDEDLKTIHVPVTIADGAHDEGIKQSHNRYMAATIPGAKLVILPEASHFAMLQRPAEFNAAVLAALNP
jgi:pimeloyl-ACP methyl ester carboxylesterase